LPEVREQACLPASRRKSADAAQVVQVPALLAYVAQRPAQAAIAMCAQSWNRRLKTAHVLKVPGGRGGATRAANDLFHRGLVTSAGDRTGGPLSCSIEAARVRFCSSV